MISLYSRFSFVPGVGDTGVRMAPPRIGAAGYLVSAGRRHSRRIRAAPPPSQKDFCLKTPALGVYDPWREILRRSLPHAPKEYPKLMAVTALVRRSGRAVQSSAFKRSEFSL